MIYVSTRAGKRHTISEDAVLVGDQVLVETAEVFPVPEKGFVCIADGVGGNSDGAVASRFVLETLRDFEGETGAVLRDYLIKTNDELIRFASIRTDSSNMATTLTGVYFSQEFVQMFHVGNTRAYVRQGKYLKQISFDHTTYNWLINAGQYEAAQKCNKSEITNCFGGKNPKLLAKLQMMKLPLFSLMLLTSDGIHDYVDLDSLEEIIAGEGSYSDKCMELIQKAEDAGSEDDMSVVIICATENTESTSGEN